MSRTTWGRRSERGHESHNRIAANSYNDVFADTLVGVFSSTVGGGTWIEINSRRKTEQKVSKPVVVTEIGYKSTSDTAVKPWEWPGRSRQPATDAELQTQANCYEAFFQTFWDKEWCAGAHFWKWFPKLSHRAGYRGRDFTPQHKPAELVMSRWYKNSAN